MTERNVFIPCAHLGLQNDRTLVRSVPTPSHRCFAQAPDWAPDTDHQEAYCLAASHVNCPYYVTQRTVEMVEASGPSRQRRRGRGWLLTLFSIVVLALLLLVVITYGSDLVRLPLPEATDVVRANAPTGTSSPTVTPTETPSVVAEAAVAASTPTSEPARSERFMTPTPPPDGQVFTLSPRQGGAGWWASDDNRRNHLGDSYLYAGDFGGQTYLSAMRFDLSRVPRGAPIEQTLLRLTGLRDDRFDAERQATWLVQLVAETALEDLARADFITAYSAPAAITLPLLQPSDLAAGKTNSWALDEVVLAWLEQQLLDGATSVTVRILTSAQDGETLFAWDSGLGPESSGEAPQLVMSVGAAPPTPPPLPTKPFVVATLTPPPENVLTVVAQAATATEVAQVVGTYTPLPYQVYTPTPFPGNLATVQAVALGRGLPPVVLDTPTPANEAIATGNAEYATAVAVTTGTFTPVPDGYATPVIVLPSPPPENIATEAARIVAAEATATAIAADFLVPTYTPLPYNAVIAEYVYATGVPENAATASALQVVAVARAQVDGTPTPLAWNAVVITRVPTYAPAAPTPLPLLVPESEFTPTPTATATVEVPDTLPEELRNKIIFLSDRSGRAQTYVLDPVTGDINLITQSWVHPLAREQLTLAPDGNRIAIVEQGPKRRLQIKIRDPQFDIVRQVTALRGTNYDPAWSPLGDRIAFVSTDTGGDEIYTTDLEGQEIQRLTFNTWEWDKHPAWSPDGSQIVFFSNRDSGRRQLWIMNADGSNPRNLSENEYNDWDPVWTR